MTIPSFDSKTTQKAAVCHGAVDLRIVSGAARRAASDWTDVASEDDVLPTEPVSSCNVC